MTGFSIPGCDGTFFLGDPRSFKDTSRGRIFTSSEVDILKRALLTPSERCVVTEVKVMFSGEIVRLGEPTRQGVVEFKRPQRKIVSTRKPETNNGQLVLLEGGGRTPASRPKKAA